MRGVYYKCHGKSMNAFALWKKRIFSNIPPPAYLEEWRQYIVPKIIEGREGFFRGLDVIIE